MEQTEKIEFIDAKQAAEMSEKARTNIVTKKVASCVKEIEKYINVAIKKGSRHLYVPAELIDDDVRSYLKEKGYYVAKEPSHHFGEKIFISF